VLPHEHLCLGLAPIPDARSRPELINPTRLAELLGWLGPAREQGVRLIVDATAIGDGRWQSSRARSRATAQGSVRW
jgi:predicted metal-dependent phosphotriesterase family hydrolase